MTIEANHARLQSMKDRIFKHKQEISHFKFDERVVPVFDDMITRSVPTYKLFHKYLPYFVAKNYEKGFTCYDLGVSTGTSLRIIDNLLKDKEKKLIGIDSSREMIKKAKLNLSEAILKVEKIEESVLDPSDLILCQYTLQFISLSKRKEVLEKIFESLKPGKMLLISEKIRLPSNKLQGLFEDFHWDIKKNNGYSLLELEQKAASIKNVLRALTLEENLSLLKSAGFKEVYPFIQVANFVCMVAVKC